VLDGGAFSLEVISQGATCAVRMVSPPDPQVGLEYTREISIDRDTPEIRFSAIMKNVTGPSGSTLNVCFGVSIQFRVSRGSFVVRWAIRRGGASTARASTTRISRC
jgi:hypothetical protein